MNSEFYNKQLVNQIINDYCSQHRLSKGEFAVLIGIHAGHLPRVNAGDMASMPIISKIAALGGYRLPDLINDTPQRIKDELINVGEQNNIPVIFP